MRKMANKKLNRKGSTLIWVLIIVMVLGILIAGGLAIASSLSNRTVTQHVEKQAYYTAYSVTKTMADWLANTSFSETTTDSGIDTPAAVNTQIGTDNQQKFITKLYNAKNRTIVENIDMTGEDMGTCVTTFKMNSKGDILISSKADYDGQDAVVSVTLKNNTKVDIEEGGTTEEVIKWWTNPRYILPDFSDAVTVPAGPWKNDSASGKYIIKNNVVLQGNFHLTGGIIFVEKGVTLSVQSGSLSMDQGKNYDFVLNVAGTVDLSNGVEGTGSILVNGGTVNLSKADLRGNQYVLDKGTLNYSSGTVTGDIYLYDGSTLNLTNQATLKGGTNIKAGDAPYNGDIYIQDGANLNVSTSDSFEGNAFVYNGEHISTISITNAVKATPTTNIWFLGPLKIGTDKMPNLENFKPNATNFNKKIHVQDIEYFSDNNLNKLSGSMFCTGNKTEPCSHKAPLLPELGDVSSGEGGMIVIPGTMEMTRSSIKLPDIITTTTTWTIGSYSGKSI